MAAGVLAGLGAGAIGRHQCVRGDGFPPARLSWLHAAYGVGAMTGPLLMTAVLAGRRSWRVGYAVLGASLAALTAIFLLTRPLWEVDRRGAAVAASAGSRSPAATLGRPAVWLNAGPFFVYTGVEVAAGQWTYSLFTEGRGVASTTAGLWAAGYWGALTAGRVAFGWLAERVPAPILLHVAIAGAPIAALALWLAPGGWGSGAGLLALGVALAPIYPLLVAETPGRLGEADTPNAIGLQVASAYLGAAALPWLGGVLVHRHGLPIIAPFLLGRDDAARRPAHIRPPPSGAGPQESSRGPSARVSSSRSTIRARWRRDFTVGTDSSRTFAISSLSRPSTSRSTTTAR
jgi:fucose permease